MLSWTTGGRVYEGEGLRDYLHEAPRGVDILDSSRSPETASVVFEHVDMRSGALTREAWFLRVRGDRFSRAVVCGVPVSSPDKRPLSNAHTPTELELMIDEFGFRPYDPATDGDALLSRAHAVVAQELGREPEYAPADVLVNEKLMYFPITWIGCTGFLYRRDNSSAVLLGSAFSPRIHVWAHYRGFAEGKTRDDRRNDLMITEIQDRRRTEDFLRRFFTPAFYEETLHPMLDIPSGACSGRRSLLLKAGPLGGGA